jgi:hypothetical protein
MTPAAATTTSISSSWVGEELGLRDGIDKGEALMGEELEWTDGHTLRLALLTIHPSEPTYEPDDYKTSATGCWRTRTRKATNAFVVSHSKSDIETPSTSFNASAALDVAWLLKRSCVPWPMLNAPDIC